MAEYLSPAVFIEEPSSGNKPIQAVGTSVGAFVGHAERGPLGVAEFIVNYGQFVRAFGGPIDDGYLAFAVKAFFDEGGGSCYVVRTCHYEPLTGVPAATAARQQFMNGSGVGAVAALTVRASSPGTWGNSITVQLARTAPDTFTLTASYAGVAEAPMTGLSMNPLSPNYAPNAVARLSALVRVTDEIAAGSPLSFADRRPIDTTGPTALGTLGTNGLSSLATADYVGNAALANGLHAFDAVEDINIVAVPDAVDRDVHVQGMAYCEQRKDCFYVADVAEAAVTTLQVLGYKRAQGAYAGGNAFNSKYGALYAPWIDVVDPRTGGTVRIPPSGAVIGRYARTDALRGVHKAPAGITDGRLASVVGLAAAYSPADQEKLNPNGINVIRRFAGTGNVIWGARTVSSDPEWRYLNVRRLFLFIEESIELSTSWTVFEPNDPALWKSIVRNVSAFLRLQYGAGALVGATEEEAFFVKCDEENNPFESRVLGRVITEIGIAPSKPAEFVIFRISQFDGGSDVSE
jgi:uncharacterized protein